MVGHTADLVATRHALEAIDAAIGKIAKATEEARGCLVITADHGNAEDMAERDADGLPLVGSDGRVRMKTAHSVNPVILLVHDYAARSFTFRHDLADAGLANVAATLVELLGFVAPKEFEPSLLA
jgi:2,3-bisphosphoglycerate-independent phosphoglycerate mutase